MITKVILGNGKVLQNVEEVQEIIQNNGTHMFTGLNINLMKNKEGKLPDVTEIENIFSQEGVLNTIKVYKKDTVGTKFNEELGEEVRVYGDEYLSLETSKYTGVQSIYKDIKRDRISIHLTTDPTKLADDKYNDLLKKNEELEQTILELTLLLGGVK